MFDLQTAETTQTFSQCSEPDWIDKHGDYLYRFALSRLRDASLAEDAVQETLLAAFRSSQNFSRLSSERTWLVGILKHKIYDHFRRVSRETNFDADETDNFDSRFFDRDGEWREGFRPTGAWNADPQKLLEQKEFQDVLQSCLSALPERLASVFVLREIDGLTGEEICRLLHLSPDNYWVMLHRARLHLRESVERNWVKVEWD